MVFKDAVHLRSLSWLPDARTNDVQGRAKLDGYRPAAAVEVAVERVGGLGSFGRDVEATGQNAGRALARDTAPQANVEKVAQKCQRSAVNGQHLHARGIVVSAVVKLEAKADLGDRGGANAGQVGLGKRLVVDAHAPSEAPEDTLGVASRREDRNQDAEDDPQGAPGAITAAGVVFLEEIRKKSVAENKTVFVADAQATPF